MAESSKTPKEPKSKRGLGRGLSALLGDEPGIESAERAPRANREAPIDMLRANPFQPRTHFDEHSIGELAASLKERGMVQPILVRPAEEPGSYEIIAGERRWRAAQKAQLHTVPIVIRELDDSEALELAIVENVQRQDLNPMEEARGYQRLIDEFGHTQAEVARTVGKSRPHVANLLRLLGLPQLVQDYVAQGRLSMGHARALIGADDPVGLAREIARRDLSVREAESLAAASGAASGAKRKGGRKAKKDADTRALENRLSQALGLRVSIDHLGQRGGRVTIGYRTLDQLDELTNRLLGS